jgi:hypothetical protein
MSKLIVICSAAVLLSGCATYQKTYACYQEYPAPLSEINVERLTHGPVWQNYERAVDTYSGGDEDAYGRNWNSLIKACTDQVYGR